MRVLAVDDEPMMLERLAECIAEVLPEAEIHSFRKASEALASSETIAYDIAFLDIQMRGMDGITLGDQLRKRLPRLNVIFTTAYSEFALDAYRQNASGYLLKPISPADVREQVNCLRYAPEENPGKQLRCRCFGNFDAYAGDRRLNFHYEKTRELLAYLVDRCGAGCTMNEIMAALWEDDTHSSYFRNLRKDLQDTLEAEGLEDILDKSRGRLGLKAEAVDCDYYDWRRGICREAYRGEYMSQYSWAEETNGRLQEESRRKP